MPTSIPAQENTGPLTRHRQDHDQGEGASWAHRGQAGQLLIAVLLISLFGTLVVTGLLLYLSTSVKIRGNDAAKVLARYAADAGVEAVLADLQQGINPLAPGYLVPTPFINDLNAAVTVAAATGAPLPTNEGFNDRKGCTSKGSGTQPYADYLVVSTAANVSLRVYARQCPGPAEPSAEQIVVIFSWKEN